MRSTVIKTDIGAFKRNIVKILTFIGSGVKLIAVVKAEAYGHGLTPCGRAALEAGADMLAVAYIDEGIVLRDAGINSPILILSSEQPDCASEMIHYNLTASVGGIELLEALNSAAINQKTTAAVHIKVDTGMGRLGVLHDHARDFIEKARSLKGIAIEGLFTHLSCADEDDPSYSHIQMDRFGEILQNIGAIPSIIHVTNSAGTLRFPQAHYTHIRPGLMLYGLKPFDSSEKILPLEKVMTLSSRIAHIKTVPPGTAISYGAAFVTKRKSRIATIPSGYGDGYPRILSGKADVLIGGKRVPVVGRICMDHFMVDVTNQGRIRIGDEAVLIGRQGDEEITAEELAVLAGTINYEITTALTARVPRVIV